MRRCLWLVGAVLLARGAWAQTSDTINPVPASGASFMQQLQTFLRREDAGRFEEQFHTGYVERGCLGATASGLGHTPTDCTAYVLGFRVRESQGLSYPDGATCTVAVHNDVTGAFGNYGRIAGTHWLLNCIDVPPASAPSGAVNVMQVTTAGGAITAVVDLRPRPNVPAFVSGLSSTCGGAEATVGTASVTLNVAPTTVTGGAVLLWAGVGGSMTRTSGTASCTFTGRIRMDPGNLQQSAIATSFTTDQTITFPLLLTPTAVVTGLNPGRYTFRLTIEKITGSGTCTASCSTWYLGAMWLH